MGYSLLYCICFEVTLNVITLTDIKSNIRNINKRLEQVLNSCFGFHIYINTYIHIYIHTLIHVLTLCSVWHKNTQTDNLKKNRPLFSHFKINPTTQLLTFQLSLHSCYIFKGEIILFTHWTKARFFHTLKNHTMCQCESI